MIKVFLIIFFTILFAELGDKTQLATFLFATKKSFPKCMVFYASASALVIATGIAVLLGDVLSKYVNAKVLNWLAGIGFITVGILTILKA